jgi:hypothetical protein
VLIADFDNNRIRMVAGATGVFYGQHVVRGDIYTIAGDGASGFAGDGGRATAAELAEPQGWRSTGPGTCSSPTTPTSGSEWSPRRPGRSTAGP